MTLHYHGTPITPGAVLDTLAGRNFCVRYGAHDQVEKCHQIGQSVMLDNGAFSFWRTGEPTDWPGYYRWAERWLGYPTTWAVIPDVIDGDEDANDALLAEWPFPGKGAPVWHLHESIERLQRLCEDYERVCLGSSGQYATIGTHAWHHRMSEAMNAICVCSRCKGHGILKLYGPDYFGNYDADDCPECGGDPACPPPVWLHMLRGMGMVDAGYPFASVDSTDVAQNHNRPQNTAAAMAARWDAKQASPYWTFREQMELAA